ncbi:hypothetical protein GLW05_15360 [Pontibacillus yanchengensis]|uniref:Uncharacterized protein n=1 Tax=Pontibacillus yanchengensis TaxID=462910 RepID=A0A6I5A3X5_9BACI|nr:TnsD family Tn7-like transposition protein [Pontibacillus yanchengensis]MYL34961.1 hypothetical protein [Pontibacillus yanchengensis]
MIGFFPKLYKDETLYSWLARYHIRSNNSSYKSTLSDLFMKDTIVAITDFPCNLQTLCTEIGDMYKPRYLINQHTPLPYYSPFIKRGNYEKIIDLMESTNKNRVYAVLGLPAGNVPYPRHLRYCATCFIEDVNQYGEPYWHRIHQIPGVHICPHHLEILSESSVLSKRTVSNQKFHALSESINSPIHRNNLYSDKENEVLEVVALNSLKLLQEEINPIGLPNLRNYYISKLHDKELMTATSRIKFQELLPRFINFYGKNTLKLFGSNLNIDDKDTWLHRLLRKPKSSCHPIRHILFNTFLGDDIFSYKNINIKTPYYQPFGDSPFPCLNRASEHFLKDVISTVNITICSSTKQPVGTFKCNCGFVFSRRGPDLSKEDRYKVGSVKQFGEVWLEKVEELYNDGLNYSEIARQLKSNRATIKKYLFNENQKMKQHSNDYKHKSYKAKWSNLIVRNPDLSRTKLREQLPSVYMWLYRNDREWLLTNMPPKQKGCNKDINKVSWETRDYELAKKIELEAESLKKINNDGIVRVTVRSIGRELGVISMLENEIEKLPECKLMLAKVTETLKDFQLRRIKFRAKNLRDMGIEITPSKLIRNSALSTKIDGDILNSIEEEIYTPKN